MSTLAQNVFIALLIFYNVRLLIYRDIRLTATKFEWATGVIAVGMSWVIRTVDREAVEEIES